MVICGIKFTHDGAVALIDDGKLIFNCEVEKLNNNPRYEKLNKVDTVFELLKENGYSKEIVDRFVVDGWLEPCEISRSLNGSDISFKLAKYGNIVVSKSLLYAENFSNEAFSYSSFMHVSGHAFSAYCTSPFAVSAEASYILVWDGGMFPQLFYFDPVLKQTESLGILFPLNGNTYGRFAQQFPPFDQTSRFDLGVAGKLMAYIALGKVSEELLTVFHSTLQNGIVEGDNIDEVVNRFFNACAGTRFTPEDKMASFHVFIEQMLVNSLKKIVQEHPQKKANLCFVGGAALNIKWNSAIRSSKTFDHIWVPPFPNDSGSALGAACCEMVYSTSKIALDWNVFCGPQLKQVSLKSGWEHCSFSIADLAALLHKNGEPVVVLHDRAEAGPRALGCRSIIAPAISASMKEWLNKVKNRENYRPVAPICLESKAPEIFIPGTPDPYMLFDHVVREEWKSKIPAVIHLDGTARLETASKDGNPFIFELLTEYEKLSHVPVLCNTSANYNGSGFFPNVKSVMEWGQVNYIWSEGQLYYKKAMKSFFSREKNEELYHAINI